VAPATWPSANDAVSNRPPDPPHHACVTLTNIATTGDPPAGSDTGLEMAWTCPVCERPGKRTREHVFGRWLAELFGVRTQPVMTFSSRDGALWSSRGFEVVVDVCAACNQGWMSNLESAFTPSLDARTPSAGVRLQSTDQMMDEALTRLGMIATGMLEEIAQAPFDS
jgi:hypothetical protein